MLLLFQDTMLTIRMPGHLTQMSRALYDLQTRGELCDLQLMTSGGTSIDLHQAVLAGAGPGALAKVRGGLCAAGRCTLCVSRCSPAALAAVVRCVYLGELHVDKQLVEEVLLVAHDLGLTKMAACLQRHPAVNVTRVTRSHQEQQPAPAEPTFTGLRQSAAKSRASVAKETVKARTMKTAEETVPATWGTATITKGTTEAKTMKAGAGVDAAQGKRSRGRPKKTPLVTKMEAPSEDMRKKDSTSMKMSPLSSILKPRSDKSRNGAYCYPGKV